MHDLIILGGGPAGVAAGIYAARKLIKTLLITRDFGGQAVIASKIENFIGFKEISGVEMAKSFEEHLRNQKNIEIKDGTEIVSLSEKGDVFELKDSAGNFYQAKNILMALGSGYKKLGISGEKEFEGKGVFYCSTCDAPLMRNKKVAVVGGGNSGLGAVRDLLPYAEKIYILEYEENLKADPLLQESLKKENKINIITSAAVKEISGNQFVESLLYSDLKTGEEKKLEVSGVFVEIGYRPNSDLVKDLVEVNKFGEIIVDHKTFKTSKKGIWAAGDITDNPYKQINIAIGDAIKAVLNIYEENIKT